MYVIVGPHDACDSLIVASPDSQSKSTIVNIATVEQTREADDWFADSDSTERRYG